ncbi:DUF748 domain-containing protein [Pseudomonas chengduensis]|jgi:uncharacterized protein involved in outer membrane biogenesis/outer membrane protein OmpA-like peptidoglycan-associated protein|nr:MULTISPECIES: DUF748 domain-containing protein [Pseudomonas]ERH49694.1 hypothetical protein O203_13370 [Pseudomonas chengduensis]KQO29564.1 hypothetical protein ASF15_14035 [Pseudomonas sp. Leaf83]MDH0958199.1 DUF748 domain-containing protein [Pseudomonas chengduensis]MDH1538040.1 DUF748 domain-containing protein [Pseudomonas chengduensis]MDH1729934.1 DUF748 domain-containing protein [Pseudomonas chengduensis]
MPKGLKRALSALLITVFLYSLIGFLILPGIALRIANQQLAQYATLPASLQRVQLNPFTLELSLWGLRIGESGQEQLSFQRLYANLQSDSLWSGALHLSDVELDGARTEILFAKDGTLNLTQLFNLPQSQAEPKAENSEPFPLRIDSIRLREKSLRFQDLRPSEAVEFAYDALNLELHNLSTLAGDNAEMTMTASGPHGAQIDWRGQVSLTPITSSGSLSVSDGRLSTFWPYVRDALPLVLKEGQVDLSSDYRLDLSSGTELQLSKIKVQLAPFAIDDPQGKPLVRLQRLDIDNTSLDLAKQQVVVGEVRSQGLEAWAAREADGQLDWQKLFAKPESANSEAAEPAQQAGESKPWQVLLQDVQLRDYKAHLADRVPQHEVAVDVGPLNLDLKNFDSLGDKPFDLRLDTGLGKQGKLQATGNVQLSPTSAQLKVATQDIDLRLAQAYLSPFIRLELRSGLLGSDLDVQLRSTEPLALSVTGSAHVDQLHTLDTLRERDFVRWKQVRVGGLDYRHGESLAIERVELDQPYARFVINENLTTNVSELIVPQQSAPNESKADAGKPLAIRIGGVAINDGSANFADFSLTPSFATAVQQMNGRIGVLDNQKPQAASVDIQGKVDRYAPMSIKGKLTPFDPLNSLDIATSFKNVELTTITPYSGKFAGYRIRKGRLNLDLHYRIEKGQLNAENKVLVENLQLGERVDSPDAVDLPIRLAVALLKDTQGRIAIELPVQGDLNNPQFSVMPIVWQTLRNLVLRAAQAPFKFIAGLVGGSNVDLSTVPFVAGSAELQGDARQALDTLAKALEERPNLRLEVEGQAAQSADGPLLAEQRLQREFRETWYKVLQRRGDRVPASPDELTVAEDEQAALLEGIYRARLKQQPPAEWAELDKEQRQQNMRKAVLDSWAQSKLLLRQLAQQRAATIKDYLVEQGGLYDERVYLIDANLGEPEADGRVLTTLHLDSQ